MKKGINISWKSRPDCLDEASLNVLIKLSFCEAVIKAGLSPFEDISSEEDCKKIIKFLDEILAKYLPKGIFEYQISSPFMINQ